MHDRVVYMHLCKAIGNGATSEARASPLFDSLVQKTTDYKVPVPHHGGSNYVNVVHYI